MASLYHSGLTLLSVASIICGCFAVNPGFRTTITNKGLDYGEHCLTSTIVACGLTVL